MKTKTSGSDHVFSCDFGDGVTATMTVDINAARSGPKDREWYTVKLDGMVTKAHLHPFRTWVLDTYERVADLLGKQITWKFHPNSTTLEVYQFVPGQPYRRLG